MNNTKGRIYKIMEFYIKMRPCCHEALGYPSHQEVKSCNILYQAKYQQIRTVSIRSWPKARFAYSFGTRKWNPARSQMEQILQQISTVPTRSRATAWFAYCEPLEFSILQPHQTFYSCQTETLCQYYMSK